MPPRTVGFVVISVVQEFLGVMEGVDSRLASV